MQSTHLFTITSGVRSFTWLFTVLFIFLLFGTAETMAATFTVTNIADTGAGSLRQAVLDANSLASDDTIVFAIPATSCPSGVCTITLATDLEPNGNFGALTINGTGSNRLTIASNGTNRIFTAVFLTFTVRDLTLTGGNGGTVSGSSPNGQGGAIYAAGGSLELDRVILTNNHGAPGGAILSGGTLVLDGVSVTGNFTGPNSNGAIYSSGTTQINNSTISGNSANDCGGVQIAGGTFTMTNSTVSGNAATATFGGGAFCNGGTLTLRNVTVSGNTAAGSNGGGIRQGGTLILSNTIIAGNTTGGANSDIDQLAGTITTQGSNLIGNNASVSGTFPFGTNVNGDRVGQTGSLLDPVLAPLANYGGPTFTHALLSGSPAINNGNAAIAGTPTSDQRGAARVGATDIGAFELNNTTNGGTFIAAMPNGATGLPYSQTITPNNVRNGITYSYAVTSGTPPPGLSLSTNFAFAETVGMADVLGRLLSPTAVVAISGTPTSAGTYPFTITATGGANAVATNYSITAFAPSAANVELSGRVTTQAGHGVKNVILTLSGGNLERTIYAQTGSFGYYSFRDVPAGTSYVLTANSKRFVISDPVRIVNLVDSLLEVDFETALAPELLIR